MIDIKYADWHNGKNQKENISIFSNRSTLEVKLNNIKIVKNGTGSISFTNNNPDRTKFSVHNNNSSLTDKELSNLLEDEFPDLIY